MDYQPTPQPANPPMSQPQPTSPPMMQPMAPVPAPRSSHAVWYIVALVIVAASAALAYWYFYGMGTPSANTPPPTAGQAGVATPPVSANTTAAIQSDLSQIPDDSAALNTAAASSASAVSGF